MVLVDLLGALLTLLALFFLALGGYLAALRLLGEEAARDPLTLAVGTLLVATAEAIAIALVLGALGVLRIDLALGLQILLVLALLLRARRQPPVGGLAAPLVIIARRTWQVARQFWAPSLLVLHGAGSEALRGLLLPPLSWDALMYHLLLAGTWLRDRNLAPVFGANPVNYYGYVPANGSLWFWWWMAPSHSELYVNLASVPHWLLVTLATGAIARQLGARRWWPLAAFLVALTPIVVRSAATEYVDLFLAGALLAGFYFGLRWLRSASWADALLLGAGLGLACGAKVLGVVFGLAAGGALTLLARGEWRRRVSQLAAAVAVTALLGGYFYLRNAALGVDPLAVACERNVAGREAAAPIAFPRRNSAVESWREMVGGGRIVEAFLGTTHRTSLEVGAGPQAALLLLAALALPWLVPRERRREGWTAALLVWAEIVFWLTIPFARLRHVYNNVRYLVSAFGVTFAAAAAGAERRAIPDRWIEGIAIALLVQDLLQLHADVPLLLRVTVALADGAAAVLLFSPAARAFVVRRRRELALAALVLALAGAPLLARFRLADRPRALANDLTFHQTSSRLFAPGWAWLDAHAAEGAVDVVYAPNNYLTYPAMGPRLERDVRYVNVDAADRPLAIRYPGCELRAAPSAEAWLRNLARRDIRWLHLARYPNFDFPLERQWADAMPQWFALRFADATNLVYEVRLPRRANAPPGGR
ncbi:MAG TPA: hypothetical protein VGS57_15710 [Thermoanaerobaculia bacterium]|jgi:hypothetical protein|nr:hypothetical protein [Thermoanaerobaculia bacterium]